MTKQGMRSFAAGLFVATAALTYFLYQDNDTVTKETSAMKEPKVEINENDVHRFAEQNNMVVLTREEYEQLTSENKEENNGNLENKQTETIYQLQLEITPGTSSQSVAERLFQAKVIDSTEAFMNHLENQKLEKSVKSGTYQLNSTMSVEEIASIITR